MRIGIDMLAVQSPWTRSRGIGRLSQNLVDALLRHDQDNEYILYSHESLPAVKARVTGRASVATLRPDPDRGESTLSDAIDTLARTNPDALDILLLLSPFDLFGGYGPPAKPLNGLKMAAYVYDAIPFLFHEKYLGEQHAASILYRHLERLRRYDVLLSCSESTRTDFRRLLDLSDRQIVTVSCDTETDYFQPDRSTPMPEISSRMLNDLGIDRPFVFNLGGMDERYDRKNLFGLIDAFRLLPESLRSTHQLVITCFMNDAFMSRLRLFADDRGVGNCLVLTNEVADSVVKILYQRCAAFASISHYEGFGLPLLEALRCGAAVVAGNNSSQPEVVGDAGLLANSHDPADLAVKLERILGDREFARELGMKAVEQARRFQWKSTAAKVVDALADAPGWKPSPRPPVRRNRTPRPRIAVMSPFPPKESGVSDYTNNLINALKADYAIDLYHDAGYVPEPGLASFEFGCHDYRIFKRRASVLNYDAVLYQMGNSIYHKFLYEMMQAHPGIVTLHDFCLAGFQYWYGQLAETPADHFQREVEKFDPRRAPEILGRRLAEWSAMPGGVPQAFVREGLYLNRSVFETAQAVVCHSPWCRNEVARLFPEFLGKVTVVPFGSRAEIILEQRRGAVRARFDLPTKALIFGSFGFMSSDKLNLEAIEAFAAIAGEFPTSLFLFIGQDLENGNAKRRAEELGIEDRMRFLGRQPADNYIELTAAIDIGVGLRRPPTHGETSAALLDLLRIGVPTIVTDVATFSDYPDNVVRKVRWEEEGLDGLRLAFRELASQPSRRKALGLSAWSYVREHHDWTHAASLYAALIERTRIARSPRGTDRSGSLRGVRRDQPADTGIPGPMDLKRSSRPWNPVFRQSQNNLQ